MNLGMTCVPWKAREHLKFILLSFDIWIFASPASISSAIPTSHRDGTARLSLGLTATLSLFDNIALVLIVSPTWLMSLKSEYTSMLLSTEALAKRTLMHRVDVDPVCRNVPAARPKGGDILFMIPKGIGNAWSKSALGNSPILEGVKNVTVGGREPTATTRHHSAGHYSFLVCDFVKGVLRQGAQGKEISSLKWQVRAGIWW